MGKTYTYVDDELVGKLDVIGDILKLKGEGLDKFLNDLTEDKNILSECLERNLLEMKLHSKKVVAEYKKGVEEELELSEKLWCEYDEKISSSRIKIHKVTDSFKDLNSEMIKLEKMFDNIPIYKIERVMELLDKFNSYSDKDKELLKILLKEN